MDKPKLADLLIDPKMGGGAFFTPIAALESIKKIMDATETVVEPKKRGVGNLTTDNTIMSYSMTFGHVVTVSATLDAERELWEFAGTIDGTVVIRGEVLGGKWRASTYLKFIRNGLISRIRRRHKVNPAKELKVESGELKVEGDVK